MNSISLQGIKLAKPLKAKDMITSQTPTAKKKPIPMNFNWHSGADSMRQLPILKQN